MVRFLCYSILKARGWKVEGKVPPDLRSFIFLGAPHTSNEDILPAMAVVYSMKRNARFVIKSEWTKFPMSLFMGPAGALGLDREKLKGGQASNTDVMAALFKEHEEFVLMIAPEGTRSPTEKWKTGFYYIAQKANVPIVLGYTDFEKKICGVGPVIYLTDIEKDMKVIMDFYREKGRGKKPENFKLDERFK